jgi:hypothetical protein
MFDPETAFKQWLQTSTAITTPVPAARILAGVDLPPGAEPAGGENWICFYSRGGSRHKEISKVFHGSFVVDIYGRRDELGEDSELPTARAIAFAISDLVYSTQMIPVSEAVVLSATEESAPQNVTDPGLDYCVVTYHVNVTMRATS